MAFRDRGRLLEWLSSPDNPCARYLTARDLLPSRPPADRLAELRGQIMDWPPLGEVLALQAADGGFPGRERTNPTARPTMWALRLMQRCGLDLRDEPVRRAVDHLGERHLAGGALSFTTGGSGVLPCYLGVTTATLIELGALDTPLVLGSLDWLVRFQRFDHRMTRAGGDGTWPYRAPANYGCWESVSCYHGVAGAFRALAAVPPARRAPAVRERLAEAVEYLRIHRVYKRSRSDRPLLRHLTEPFLVGDYRSGLLDLLQGIADADPALGEQDWVREAVADMAALTVDGAVPLVKNYGAKLMVPVPLEPVGEPSRLLTYQWLKVLRDLDVDLAHDLR